jgi:hypothetical protein
MNRRNALLALPAAALVASGQSTTTRAATTPAKQRANSVKAKKALTPAQLKDRHVFALMLLLMRRKDVVKGTAKYPAIDYLKSKPAMADFQRAYPAFGKVDTTAFQQILLHLQGGGDVSDAAQKFQQAVQSVSTDVQPAEYPDNQCPFGDSIDAAIAALLAP